MQCTTSTSICGSPLLENPPESLAALTIALLAVSQEWRYDDLPSLSRTHAQQPLVHALDQPAGADIGVISATTTVAAENEREVMQLEEGEAGLPQGSQQPLPGVEGSAIQQCAIVVVADKVAVLDHAVAVGRVQQGAHLHGVCLVPHIQKDHIKVEGRIRGNKPRCEGQQPELRSSAAPRAGGGAEVRTACLASCSTTSGSPSF